MLRTTSIGKLRRCTARNPADFQIAVPQLLSHGRPFTALQVIHLGLVCTPDLPSNLVFDTLDAIRRPNADQRPQDAGYETSSFQESAKPGAAG